MTILYPVLSTPFFFATLRIDLQKEEISLSDAFSTNEEKFEWSEENLIDLFGKKTIH